MKIRTSKPRKQRKILYTAHNFLRRKIMSAHLSPELRKTFKRRAVPIRKGDLVRIMRGEMKGTSGKVVDVDRKRYRIAIEGVQRERADGTKRMRWIHPSNVMITELNLEDREREKMMERR